MYALTSNSTLYDPISNTSAYNDDEPKYAVVRIYDERWIDAVLKMFKAF